MFRRKSQFTLPISIALTLVFSVHANSQEILSWQECLQEARANHPDIKTAFEEIIQAQANVVVSRSELLPGVDFDASARSSWDRDGSSDSYSHGFSGSQLIFDGFQSLNELRRTKENLVATRYNYMVASSNVRFRLRSTFVNLLRQQELVNITTDILKRRQDSLELVKLRYDAGREHKGALLTAQANAAAAQADVNSAKRNLILAQRRLIKEMGREKFSPVESSGVFDVADEQSEQPDFEAFAATTPLLKELMSRTEAAKYDVSVSRGAYLPDVFLSSGFGRSDNEWPPRQEDWSVGFRVSIPIFDGGSRGALLKRSKSDLRQSEAVQRSGRDGVIVTLNQTWAAFQDALENVRVQQKFLESAEARAKISEAQYSNGLITFDDWIIIEDSLVRTKTTFLDAQAGALLAEAAWVQAKGGTLENDD